MVAVDLHQRVVQVLGAVAHGSGEILVEQQEFCDQCGVQAAVHTFTVGLVGARALQGAHPALILHRPGGGIVASGLGHGVLQALLQHPQRVVAAFQGLPGPHERPALVARQGGERDPEEELRRVAGGHAVLEQAVVVQDVAVLEAQRQVRAVQALPHLAGNAVAQAPRVLAGPQQRTGDRPRVVAVKGHPRRDRAGVQPAVLGPQLLLAAREIQQRGPVLPAPPGGLQRGVVVHVQHAGRVLGTFHVAADPVQALGQPRQQQHYPSPPVSSSFSSCCWYECPPGDGGVPCDWDCDWLPPPDCDWACRCEETVLSGGVWLCS